MSMELSGFARCGLEVFFRHPLRFLVFFVTLVISIGGEAAERRPIEIPPSSSTSGQVMPAPVVGLDAKALRNIEVIIKQFMHENHIPGLAVGIVKNYQIVYGHGYGLANLDKRTAVTPSTVFQLGSESKMMMGIAMMQLQMRGMIDLDKPIHAYLPYFHLKDRRYKQITAREILSHRSGLPWCPTDVDCETIDYKSPEFDAGALERHVRSLGRVMLQHAPGTTMQYSDLGFEVLGDVVAKISGVAFETYMRRKIFAPLGMHQTSFLLTDIKADLLAAPHVGGKKVVVNAYYPYSREHAPSSHLLSTVTDMNRFALAVVDQRHAPKAGVLPTNAFIRMWTPEIATNMPSPWERQLGLGWFLGAIDNHRLVGHAGGDTGFASDSIFAPDDGAAVTVMVNCDREVEELTLKILRLILGSS